MKPVVMFVDDEINVLSILERSLHKMRKKWDMVFYANAEEALDHLAEGPIDLVVSDLRMPVMDGAVFLDQVAERSPHTIRFMLSGYTDDETALRVVDICHQVLSKPCDTENLVRHVQRALASREILPDRDMQSKVSRIQHLPSRPEVQDLILKELSSETPSFDNLAALVAEDIGLSAKVLQIAASGFFNGDTATPSLVSAVSRLGVQRVKAVVRSHGVEKDCCDKVADEFDLEALWLHSMACANLCQAIAGSEQLPKAAVENAFIAGLLHDVGRLVMAASEPELYIKHIARFADPDTQQGLKAEEQIFKGSHPQIGAYLTGLWGFPEDIVRAIAYHHTPSQCPVHEVGSLTYLHAAEFFCRIDADGESSPMPEFDAAYYETLGIEDRLAAWKQVTRRMVLGEPD